MDKNIVGVNERYYQNQHGPLVPIKAVLVLGIDKLCRGYLGCGSEMWVADFGTKMSYNEARIHFPSLEEKDYSSR